MFMQHDHSGICPALSTIRKQADIFRQEQIMTKQYHFSLKTPFRPGNHPDGSISSAAFWFIFSKEKILVQIAEEDKVRVCSFSPEDLGLPVIFTRYLGRYGVIDCFVAELDDIPAVPPAMQFRGLRSLFGVIDDDLFSLAGRAIQIIHWHREHRFCGKCATPMIDRRSELARKCPNCDFISYPRLSPAVIMSVVREDRILLARAPRFPAGMYSTLAGFVEPGETLEEAVRREVSEEVAVSIDNIQYVASQPWPFPHSIMIGFSATYAGGEIRIDEKEIEDAGWFSVDELPQLPAKISIAHLLIENFIKKKSKKS